MTELEKYEKVNKCKDIESLKNVITEIGDITISSGEIWSSEKMNRHVDTIESTNSYYTLVTRNYGIRQQLYFLMACKKESI